MNAFSRERATKTEIRFDLHQKIGPFFIYFLWFSLGCCATYWRI